MNGHNESISEPAAPRADRPHIPGYGIPEDRKGILPWSHAVERLEGSQNYWVATTDPDGQPHTVAVWGVWVEGALSFGGGPETRWSRNLARNPTVAVHLESGEDVVILEGTVDRVTDPSDPRMARIDDAYEAKYEMRHGPPIWILRPRVAFGWNPFGKTATRWRFADPGRG
ncbi:MAG: pyridoxamine 5'-phosphate oxidase family protein [Actinomycetota bacterium]